MPASGPEAPAPSIARSGRFACEPATPEACRRMLRSLLDPIGVAPDQLNRIEVVLEEIVTNVLRHSAGAAWLDLGLAWQADVLTLRLTDDGAPFDPLAAPAPEPFAALSDAPLGGLGIVLVRKLAASLRYERTASGQRESNCLQVTMPAARVG